MHKVCVVRGVHVHCCCCVPPVPSSLADGHIYQVRAYTIYNFSACFGGKAPLTRRRWNLKSIQSSTPVAQLYRLIYYIISYVGGKCLVPGTSSSLLAAPSKIENRLCRQIKNLSGFLGLPQSSPKFLIFSVRFYSLFFFMQTGGSSYDRASGLDL